ncbi:MAG: RNA-binding protein [Pirellulales bacterium]|nr:RNA-binding protein [Pirellulales bacterium]
MGRRIYVGNLPWTTTSQELTDLFGEFGGVVSAEVLSDRETGRSRGFGFVEMESDAATEAAIAGMNGKDMGGRALTVNEARERTPRPAGSGSGRGGYGGGGYGGGYGRR